VVVVVVVRRVRERDGMGGGVKEWPRVVPRRNPGVPRKLAVEPCAGR
jgi:hypothetical protein